MTTVKDIKYHYCSSSASVMLRYRLSMMKYLVNRKKYPLFSFSNPEGGLSESQILFKKMKTRKFVQHNGSYYFSLSAPHWPSKAFDKMAANGGLNLAAAGTELKHHIDNAIVGITRKCNYNCIHCYEYHNLKKKDTVSVFNLLNVIKRLQEYGVGVITLSGGEPMLRYDGLLQILKEADHSKSDFHIHTSGFGVTRERAIELKKAGLNAAGVALDNVESEKHDNFRGFKGAFQNAINGLKYFQDAGVFTYVNMCLTNEIVNSGDIYKYFDLMKSLKVGFVRWLEPKPCGAYLKNEGESGILGANERAIVTELYINANTGKSHHDYPVISYEAYVESPENLGCIMGGNSLIYIDTAGNVEPCVFLPVSFGNILHEDFSVIFDRMKKAIPGPVKKECPAVTLSSEINNLNEKGFSLPVSFEEISIM